MLGWFASAQATSASSGARKEWPISVNSYSTRGGISATRGHRDRAQSGEDRLPAEGKGDAWNKDGLAELLRGHDAVVRALSALFVEGEFRLGKDALLTIDKGSSISFEDCAVALVDEIEKPAHSRQRFTVGY